MNALNRRTPIKACMKEAAMTKRVRLSLLAALLSAAPLAQAADCDKPDHVWPASLTIKSGLQDVLPLPGAATRVSVGDPATADVTLLDPRNLLVQARKAGETSLMLWTKCSKEPARIILNVPASLSAAQQVAQAADPEALKVLPSQVQVDIRFVELSRSRLRDMGIRMSRSSGKFMFGSNNVDFDDATQAFKIPVSSNPFNMLWGGAGRKLNIAVNMLEEKGYAYTLSQPSLVALSGQTATFLAGGEVPILVPQSGTSGSITVEYKEFGVRLSVTPTVLSSNQVVLKVAPEVSELDYTNAVTLQGSTIPALRVRRTDTSISMQDGESFVISGLVSRTMRDSANKMPMLGDIPVLGAFFRSTSFDSEDSELLMIVTPRLVKPLAADAPQPQLPGESWRNYEPGSGKLFWQGADSPYRDSPVGFSR